MVPVSSLGKQGEPLSVAVISAVVTAYVCVLASATILTHVAQLLGIPFRIYAYASAVFGLAVLGAVIVRARQRIGGSAPQDAATLVLILIIGLISGQLAVSMHRVGRISPDEYYYAVNPVYYTQHPDDRMGFQNRLFYSQHELESAGFFTAGAFEYAEAAFAFLANMRFATAYYFVGAGIIGALIPLSIFLAVYCLSGSAAGSTLGAAVTVLGITLMGETSWAPGANSFVRAFEGKAFLQFAGVPLLAAFTVTYFSKPGVSSWLALFALGVALAGTSTTSFAMAPLLTIILCAAYWIARRPRPMVDGRFLRRAGAVLRQLRIHRRLGPSGCPP